MKNNFLTKILFILPVILGMNVVKAQKVKKPNVIIVITDDQGYGDLACTGNPIVKTPNLTRCAF
jgi:hypothetical protein